MRTHLMPSSRKIRALLLTLIGAVILTACSQIPTKPQAPSAQAVLQQAQHSQDPQRIAQARMALARQLQGEARAKQQMQAIETAIDAEDYTLAAKLYSQADTQSLWDSVSTQRADLLSGFNQWQQGQPVNALNLVSNVPVPLTQTEVRRRLLLLADILSSMNQPLDAARQRVALDGMLTGQQAEKNRAALWNALDKVSVQKLAKAIKQASDPNLTGWLSLAMVYRTRPGELGAWIQNHPQHSAVTSGFAPLLLKQGSSYALSGQPGTGPIIVLLPETGDYKPISKAIKAGINFARQRLGLDASHSIKFIDSGTTAADFTSALAAAYADQPSTIIGPLLKPQLAALQNARQQGVPILALNAPDDDQPLPPGVISFALSPENDSRAAADRMIADHKMRALLFCADNDLGQRSASAFAREYTLLGGQIVDQAFFDPSATDFSDQLDKLLQVDSPKHGPFQPTIRDDVDGIFLGATGQQAAMIIPQLDYFGADQLPRYGISLAYGGSPDPQVDQDKDGLIIPVEPLLLAANAGPNEPLRATWEQANLATNLPRLFGFGADALLIASHLNSLTHHQSINGLTGTLSLSRTGVIERKTTFGQFRDGLLQPMDGPENGPLPSTVLTPNAEGDPVPQDDEDGSKHGMDAAPASPGQSAAQPQPDSTGTGTPENDPSFTDGGGVVSPAPTGN